MAARFSPSPEGRPCQRAGLSDGSGEVRSSVAAWEAGIPSATAGTTLPRSPFAAYEAVAIAPPGRMAFSEPALGGNDGRRLDRRNEARAKA